MNTLTLIRPDDWHLHLRDGAAMHAVVPHSTRQFARAVIMPNLRPPVTTTQQALAYRARILEAVPLGLDFEPLMTLYLTRSNATCRNRPRQKLRPCGGQRNSILRAQRPMRMLA